MPAGGLRKSAAVAAFAALIVVTIWLLDRFARREFVAHLSDQSAYALALAASGGTPYAWRFHTSDDLVAGHPFGTSEFSFADGGLRLPATDATVEVGLPLSRAVDLRSFPLLRVELDAQDSGSFRIVLRETLDSAERVSAPVAFAPGEYRAALDVRAVAWDSAEADAPASAAMLRIRREPRAAVLLRNVLLQRPLDYAPLNIAIAPPLLDAAAPAAPSDSAVYRLPFAPAQQQVDIAAIAAKWKPPQPPLILLPQRGRVEQQIALRNAVYAALPAAILIPEGAYEETFAAARDYAGSRLRPGAPGTDWWVVAAFGAVLLLARWRPPREARLRALLEIGLTLAAPMWLVVSGRIDGGSLHAPQTVLIGFSLIYAVSLSLHPSWRLNGSAAAWTAAAAVVGGAVLIGLAARGPGVGSAGALVLRHFGLYLGWALLQQFLVCAICTERWQAATGSRYAAAYLGALCFALLHTPNATLMLATFVGGLCWCGIWLRYRALLPLALSHAASALALAALLPADVLHSAEVSVRFFQ